VLDYVRVAAVELHYGQTSLKQIGISVNNLSQPSALAVKPNSNALSDTKFAAVGIVTEHMRAAIGGRFKLTWLLRAGRIGVASFYEELGFKVSEVAMEHPGGQPDSLS
jgi:hypothetical protein